MIPTIIILLGALYWLLKETDYLRVRLPMGKPANKTTESQPQVSYDPNFKPSEFIPLDMPEFTGKVNILCERGIQ